MKRIICFMLSCTMLFTLASCNNPAGNQLQETADTSVEAPPEEPPAEPQVAPMESNTNGGNTEAEESRESPEGKEMEIKRKISVTGNGNTILYELNDSPAAKDLFAQLPLTVEVENFSTNEKIFYPPEKLNTENTPLADAEAGVLCYYAPWGDVVMFYGNHDGGIYELGKIISGEDNIEKLSGTIEISAIE